MLFFVPYSKIGSLLIYFLTANKNYQENLILITNTYDFMMVSECENQQALGRADESGFNELLITLQFI